MTRGVFCVVLLFTLASFAAAYPLAQLVDMLESGATAMPTAAAETEAEVGAGHARAREDRESGEEARELSGDGAEPNKKAKK